MIAIVDYGIGNLGSLANMLRKIGANPVVSSDPLLISKAKKLLLPGVGSFDKGIKNLADKDLVPLLNELVLEKKIPILGICLGMQLFSKNSEEGKLSGLGWLDAETTMFKFENRSPKLKVPHMGWNNINIRQKHPLLTNLEADNRFYFVHSYHVVCSNPDNILASTSYGIDFASMILKDNIMGAQFHPEKSHKFGMRLLKNFVELV